MNAETAKQIAEASRRFGQYGSARSAGGSETTQGRRRAGSVRFDPYYKVQWYDTTSLTWRDIQKAHQTETDGWDAADAYWEETGRMTRLMEITMDGRQPLPGRRGAA